MEQKIKLPENIILIDAQFLNTSVKDLKQYFEPILGRDLQEINLAHFISYLALDAGYQEGEHQTQVMFVYDSESSKLYHTQPTDVKEDLDGVAFDSQWGEFSFAAVPSEGMVTRGDLFTDLLQIVLESKDVKRAIIISDNEEYGDQVTEILQGSEGKEIIQFRMQESDNKLNYRWEFLPYTIMQSLGIRGDELK